MATTPSAETLEALEALAKLEDNCRGLVEIVKEIDDVEKIGQTLVFLWISGCMLGGERRQFYTVFMAFMLGAALASDGGTADALDEIKRYIAQSMTSADDLVTAAKREMH